MITMKDVREDFVYDVYKTLDFLPTNNEANQIIESFEKVASSENRNEANEEKLRNGDYSVQEGKIKFNGE